MRTPKGAACDDRGQWWSSRSDGTRRRLHRLMCAECGGDFIATLRRTKCCSRECSSKNRTGKRNANWRGGRGRSGAGYVSVWVDPHGPMGGMGDRRTGRVLEHRLVMAQAIGRPLETHEQVHHINGIRTDNRLENLELWSTSHPAGKRVEDLLAWAHDIIELYERVHRG